VKCTPDVTLGSQVHYHEVVANHIGPEPGTSRAITFGASPPPFRPSQACGFDRAWWIGARSERRGGSREPVPNTLHVFGPALMKLGKLPQKKDRAQILNSRRTDKMARSANAYVRGNTLKFYEWLEAQQRHSLPEGPPVWICGDCHAGNLGPVADAKGRVEIQIRDLDQTVIGNPSHDLIRLGLSLALAARGSDLPGVTTAKMLEQMIDGYSQGLSKKVDGGEARPEAVSVALKSAVRRSWKHLAQERIEDPKPTLPFGNTFWPLARIERSAIKKLFEQENVRKLATMLRSRDDDAPVEVLDAAYWVKGCSSLGRLRFAVVLGVGKNAKRSLCLMDMKEATEAVAPRYPKSKMPRDNAARIIEGARHLAPFLGQRMLAAKLVGRSVFLRELLPQDLKLEIDQLTRKEAMKVARYLAGVVGTAHGRQMDAQLQKSWRKDISGIRSKSLDAPSWLWSSVVALVASHEAAYLEHCRKYAAAAG